MESGHRRRACNKGEDEAAAASSTGFVLKHIVCLVGTRFYFLVSMLMLFSSNATSGKCSSVLCSCVLRGNMWLDDAESLTGLTRWMTPTRKAEEEDDEDVDRRRVRAGFDISGVIYPKLLEMVLFILSNVIW